MSEEIIWAAWCGAWALFWFTGMFNRREPEPFACAWIGLCAVVFGVVPLLCPVARAETHRDPAVTREFQRLNPCPSTAKPYGACPNFVRDHVIPLACGGPDSIANMVWQSTEEAKIKDRWERECWRWWQP